jgi:hypothetical protein
MSRTAHFRQGLAAIWALVILAVITVLMTLITWQGLAGLRQAERREHQLQADWLARSGLELAAARLLAADDFKGETFEPVPRSRVTITVETKPDSPGFVRVTSEARYPVEGRLSVVRTATRVFRRVADKERVRVEVVPSPGWDKPAREK